MVQHHPPQEGVIRPRKGKRDPDLGPDAVMVMIPSDLAYVISRTKAKKVSFMDSGLYGLYKTEEEPPVDMAVAGPFFGAPHAVMGIEKLIALGARRIWALGWCGSLQSDLRIGDMIIPLQGISEEGVSEHYPLAQKEATSDLRLCRLVEGHLKAQEVHFQKGTVWTTDAVYRETPGKIRRYETEGVLGVEMEISALLTVSAFRGVAFIPLLVISDELFDLKWRPGFSDPVFKENCKVAGDAVIAAVMEVNNG
ncbi:MAG: nucleoside phosphorylase [Deltaproteobacteria bacterium]